MISINSNASAAMAMNNLFSSQNALNGNMQQLSTGLRINSASDDAAGLQISNRMQTQMNGLNQAQRNAGDAISMAQTAEGAMSENTNILNRMRDLSVQAGNDTNTDDDRAAMQKEVEALVEEVDRIANTTSFAGKKLLDGSAESLTFQIGANAGETLEFGIEDMSASALKGEVTATVTEFDTAEVDALLAQVNSDGEGGDGSDITLTLNGEDITISGVEDGEQNYTASSLAAAINGAIETAEIEGVRLSESGGEFTFISDKDLTISGDLNGTSETKTQEMSLEDIDISTAEGAAQAIEILDGALKQVDEQRADLGAVQNRLDSTISNLANVEENLGVSQSRILDADFASQTVEMTSNQMLMQAGTSVLAQAKGMPQYATMLL